MCSTTEEVEPSQCRRNSPRRAGKQSLDRDHSRTTLEKSQATGECPSRTCTRPATSPRRSTRR
ncbi:hypothetical protein M758_1G258100 [Ceratodon purpureus]|nr:hypothetical protein M758_1G258100 [Ceratodon purpureus]